MLQVAWNIIHKEQHYVSWKSKWLVVHIYQNDGYNYKKYFPPYKVDNKLHKQVANMKHGWPYVVLSVE
jgi:hypothetical protein